MAKASSEQGVINALVRAGLIGNPNMVKSVTIKVESGAETTVVVERHVSPGQVTGAVDELVREGYTLVKDTQPREMC